LKAFQDFDEPFMDVLQLKTYGFDCLEQRFIFHLQIMEDQGLVQDVGGVGLGYEVQPNGQVLWSPRKLRLTAAGHEFIEALEKSDVWEIIKRDFREESIGTLMDVALKLAKGFANERLKKYLMPD
jgi:hypothetical protein